MSPQLNNSDGEPCPLQWNSKRWSRWRTDSLRWLWLWAWRLLAYDLNAVSCQIQELWHQVGGRFFAAVLGWAKHGIVIDMASTFSHLSSPYLPFPSLPFPYLTLPYLTYVFIVLWRTHGHHIIHPFFSGSSTESLVWEALNVLSFAYREIASMLRTQWEERIIDQPLAGQPFWRRDSKTTKNKTRRLSNTIFLEKL